MKKVPSGVCKNSKSAYLELLIQWRRIASSKTLMFSITNMRTSNLTHLNLYADTMIHIIATHIQAQVLLFVIIKYTVTGNISWCHVEGLVVLQLSCDSYILYFTASKWKHGLFFSCSEISKCLLQFNFIQVLITNKCTSLLYI
jgi:hypothetical protein